jgi:hypothetical protein
MILSLIRNLFKCFATKAKQNMIVNLLQDHALNDINLNQKHI